MDHFEEHFDEASFLWHQREHALVSPRLTPEDTAALEWRLRRHVDGLVLAGTAAVEKQLVPALEGDEPERIAVATLALVDEDIKQYEPVLDVLRQSEPIRSTAICQALQTRPRPGLETPLLRIMEVAPPVLQALLLDVLSHWRAIPQRHVDQLILQGEPLTKAAALRAVLRLPTRSAAALIIDCLSAPVPEIRQAAITSGLMLGVPAAWAACLQQAVRPEPASAPARLLIALGGEDSEQALLLKALSASEPIELHRQTLWALGFSGKIGAAEACLPLMSSREPFLARLAGEAFCAITGLRLEGSLVTPDDEAPLEEEEDPEAAAIPPPETWIPLPRADAVAAWWQRNRQRFSPNVRYLEGHPCSPEGLLSAFEGGSMRRRSAIALELTLRSQGAWAPALRAFLDAQQRELAGAHTQSTRARMISFAKLARMGAPPPTAPVQSPRPAPGKARAAPSPEFPVVTAMGMVSSLGLGIVASCAAARAGLLHATELEGCEALDPSDGGSYPVRGHSIPSLTQGFTGLGRLARLGEAALGELKGLEMAGGWTRTGLYVALPSGTDVRTHAQRFAEEEEEEEPAAPTNERLQPEQQLLPLLTRLTGLRIPRHQQRVFPRDALGFLHALQEALKSLMEGRLESCIVGGIDCLVEPSRLQALKALGLLKVPSQPARMLPGEAAAFLVLERSRDALRRGAQILATCEGIRVPDSSPPDWAGAASAGRALADSLSATLTSLTDQGRHTGRVIGCLNGNDRRAYAWGHALPIIGDQAALGHLPLWSPAESFGEVGAAAGPVAVCMAVRDFVRGATDSPHALVWLVDDQGAPVPFMLGLRFVSVCLQENGHEQHQRSPRHR